MKLETVGALKKIDKKDGFVELNDDDLRKLQGVLLSILKDFDRICRKYGIVYTLGGGSALGAVRHKGFIPWDDDIDINMERKEYERFCEVFETELSEKYWLHTPEKRPDLGLGLARMRLKGTICRVREDLFNDECGFFIDIFIIENTYDFLPMRYLHGFLSLVFGFLLSCRNFYRNRSFYLSLSGKGLDPFRIKVYLGFLISFLPVSFYTFMWNSVNRMCRNDSSEYVCGPVGRHHFFGELYIRNEFCVPVETDFSDMKSFVCRGYDSYLKQSYGDYMKIPSEKDREKHVVLEIRFN